MAPTSSWRVYILCFLSHIIGLCIFLKGFFPSKVVLPGHNEFSIPDPFLQSNGKAQFENVIVMVVDAMRADFLFSESRSEMKFVHSLINQNSALPYTAFSTPPTVTLPRLKGITTGGTPNFLDAILNVADDKDDSQGLSSQDSWVHQFKYCNPTNRELHFFGDDTWLKLFPPEEYFEKFEGTNSFFVSDFTDVDNNVTRHLNEELSKESNWSGLILHYLGLDHIGHKGGPDSVFMGSKQKEMDSIIERLYNYIIGESSKETLLVVMGDHGMNEIGNHGGSSVGETSPGLLLISPKFQKLSQGLKSPLKDDPHYQYYRNINQIDLVPTLASLLNFPIPTNNLGVVIENILGLWDSNEKKHAILLENCQQFKRLVEAKYSSTDNEYLNIMSKWEKIQGLDHDSAQTSPYYDFLYEVQDILSLSATNYNYSDIWCGFLILTISSLSTWLISSYYFLMGSQLNKALLMAFQACTVLYSVHFHGSSLIEEEYQIWWFFSIIFIIFLFCYSNFKGIPYFILLITGFRLIRSWNNSGQKFSTPFTTAAYFLNNVSVLWSINFIVFTIISFKICYQGYFVNCFSIGTVTGIKQKITNVGGFFAFVLTHVVSSISFVFKLSQFHNDGNKVPKWALWIINYTCDSFGIDIENSNKNQFQEMNIQLARISFYGILILLLLRILLGKLRNCKQALITDLTNIMTILLMQQSRCENIPIFLIFFITEWSISKILHNDGKKLRKNLDELIIISTSFSLCVQNLSFFSIGNTNLLATVDLSNAYNGVSSYDVFLVGLLTFISNYAVVIFWSFASLKLIFEDSFIRFSNDLSENLINYPTIFKKKILIVRSFLTLTFYGISVINLVGSCINLRFHLFIWTVFSPKLLYFASWSVLMNGLIDFLVASTLIAIS